MAEQKQIIAIVLVIGIGVGIGLGVYFLTGEEGGGGTWDTPGAPADPENILKIGILDDLTYTTGVHCQAGAELAATEINQAGGIVIGGDTGCNHR